MIQALGFDLDGTILLSEDKKEEIMTDLLSSYLKIDKNKISSTYKDLVGQGITNSQKIVMLSRQLANKTPSDGDIKKISDEFSKKYVDSMKSCPLISCRNILEEFSKEYKVLFVISMSDEKDVCTILEHCGLKKYFKEIRGAPKSKQTNLKYIIKKYNLDPKCTIYIGDTLGDAALAESAGMTFIGVKDHKNWQYTTLSDFCNLKAVLDKIDQDLIKGIC